MQVENILKHLFPVPKDDSKRVITFANMQDYISFRHHTYEQPAGVKSIVLKVLFRWLCRATHVSLNSS